MDEWYWNKLIRKRREELGLTQNHIALHLGVWNGTYCRWENCKFKVDVYKYGDKLAGILDLEEIAQYIHGKGKWMRSYVEAEISNMSDNEFKQVAEHVQSIKSTKRHSSRKKLKSGVKPKATIGHSFGARLKALREENNMNQTNLAKKLRTSQSYLCQLERGEHQPNLLMLERIAAYFDVSYSYLIDELL